MNFGEAIEALKLGKMVTRKGWNGKGMYLWLMPAATVKAEWCREPHLKALAEENGGEVECLGSIRMKTADNKVLTGWLASQTDMLSEDWEIFGENDKETPDMEKCVVTDNWNYRGVRFFRANVCPISFEDAEVDGESDDEDNPKIPCIEGNRWNILIDIKTGQVINWKRGVDADVFYKVCDDGIYTAYDNGMDEIYEIEDYVPKLLEINENGYGDYIEITIGKDGFIKKWPDEKEIARCINAFLDGED